MFLKQSTAFTDRIGPFLDKDDGVTEEEGLTTAAAAIFLSKNGGDFAAKNDATALVHDQDGWYIIVYDGTDTGTVGKLEVMVQAPATHLPVWKTYWVLEESIYDSLFAASAAGFDANQRVDVGSWLGTAVTVGNGAPDVNIQSTDDIDLSATQKASVNTEADTALTDYDPPTRTELTSDKNEIITDLDDIKGTGFVKDTHSLVDIEAYVDLIDDGTSGLANIKTLIDTIDTVVDAIKLETDKLTLGDAGAGVAGSIIEEIENRATPAQVQTELGTYDAPTKAEMDTAHALLATPAQVNTEVLDVLNTDTFAEPTGVPAATATLVTKLGYLYMALRNQIQITATKKTFFDDSGTAEWEKDLSDDGTTYQETEGNAI